ncbi:MAG: MFS transporter [Calditrichaeota bacterium]|nr:MAG: MFS transporter [Calditrichota bacterium]
MNRLFTIYKNAYRGLPRPVWELSIATLINRAGTMVIVYLMLYLTEKIGLSPTAAGRIISIYGIGAVFGTLAGGWLADKITPHRVQLSSLFTAAVLFIILGYLKNLHSIAIVIFLLALTTEAFRPANSTAIAEVSPPEKRARSYALNRLAINLGFSVGPVVGGFLAHVNYHYLFWVDGITSALAGFYLYFLHRRKTAVFTDEQPEEIKTRSPWRDAVYASVLLFMLLIGMLFYQIFNVWPLYLREIYHLAENQIGPLLAINGLLIVLIEMPLVHRLERAKPVRIIALGSLLICGGQSLLPFFSSYAWIALTVIIWTIGEMLCFPLMIAFIANRAGDKNRGAYMGMYSFTFSIAMVVSPIIGTWIYESMGPNSLWHIAGILGLVVFSGLHAIDRFGLQHSI